MSSKSNFNKPPLPYKYQLHKLANRGLVITNEAKALHLLEMVSYYRLNAYWYPFWKGINQSTYLRKILTLILPSNYIALIGTCENMW